MPDLVWESQLKTDGFPVVAGIDEAGRGPLAGPVVAAAVILPDDFELDGLNDSKQIAEPRREALYDELTANGDVIWKSALATVEEIDSLNILHATHLAMRRAVEALAQPPVAALIDGLPVKNFPLHQQALVKGDSISLSIAAASIIAKVERDRLMRTLAVEFPEYGFEKNKGYGTKYHLTQLDRHGPCSIHRKSFQPIAQLSLPLDPVN